MCREVSTFQLKMVAYHLKRNEHNETSNKRIQTTTLYVVANDSLQVTKAAIQIKICFQDNPARQRQKLARCKRLIRALPT